MEALTKVPISISSPSGSFTLAKSQKNPKSNQAFLSSNRKMSEKKLICKISEREIVEKISSKKGRMEEYNIAMKKMMRNPYDYHHDLGMNYALIRDNLIVGSQPQKADDINHLKEEQNVAYILCLQQDSDIEYWGIDLKSILNRCNELGVTHMRTPTRDFDGDSLRHHLPKAVSLLDWAISQKKGRVYVHCTAGLGRAPAVVISYLFWFCNLDLNKAYNELTSKRPCGPNKTAIRGATYDLAKNGWKETFENLPDHAFNGVNDSERQLIVGRVRGLRSN